MHPYLFHEIARYRMDDLHREAEHARLVALARQASRGAKRPLPRIGWYPVALTAVLFLLLVKGGTTTVDALLPTWNPAVCAAAALTIVATVERRQVVSWFSAALPSPR